jgi:hypothetical protein
MLVWPWGWAYRGCGVAGATLSPLVRPWGWSRSHGFPGCGVPAVTISISVSAWVFVGPGWWARLGDNVWSGSELVSDCGFVGGGR